VFSTPLTDQLSVPCRTLEVLQDQVTPQPFEDINEVLQREFGAGAHELFAEFEEHSTAAASLAQVRDLSIRNRPLHSRREMQGLNLAQPCITRLAVLVPCECKVHKARLLTGEPVAVKIQYAGLESAVAADLATFSGLAALAGAAFPDFKLGWVGASHCQRLCQDVQQFPEAPAHRHCAVMQVVVDLRQQLAEELDFRREAHNSRALATAMQDNPNLAVPTVHDALSNERVITMDWVSGAKVGAAFSMLNNSVTNRRQMTALAGSNKALHC
jgi:predicted unusual protein kinase regulating ubiquinone biosynthesis (AarF/ABC1/UbiB family)